MLKLTTWCYSIRDVATGDKLVGGTMKALTMHEVAEAVIKMHKLKILNKSGMFDFVKGDDSRKVRIYVTVTPEEFLDKCEVIQHEPKIVEPERCPACGQVIE